MYLIRATDVIYMCSHEDTTVSSAGGFAESGMSKLLPYMLIAILGVYLAYEFVR